MTITLCDFCGGEMKDGRRATLTIGQGKRTTLADPWSLLAGTASSDDESMLMCANCLGHLLPITMRVREARIADAKKRTTPKVGALELSALQQLMQIAERRR